MTKLGENGGKVATSGLLIRRLSAAHNFRSIFFRIADQSCDDEAVTAALDLIDRSCRSPG